MIYLKVNYTIITLISSSIGPFLNNIIREKAFTFKTRNFLNLIFFSSQNDTIGAAILEQLNIYQMVLHAEIPYGGTIC